MAYRNLFGEEPVEYAPKKKPTQKKSVKRGCEGCPLNTGDNVKIIGLSRVTGKRIFVWAQSPGYKETKFTYTDAEGRKRVGMELIGPSGEFFWKHAGYVGIKREDCDIQNVCRCRPTEYDEKSDKTIDRKPTSVELTHCSIYTDRAIEKAGGKAKVHIVLGLVAAKALLGREYRKDRSVFWSERLGAKVICIAHPAYFLRDGYSKTKLDEFKTGLRAAAEAWKGKATSRYTFVEGLDFKGITTATEFAELAARIKAVSKKTRPVLDFEDAPKEDTRILLCCGFSIEPGVARTVYLEKSDIKVEEKARSYRILESLLTDPDIPWIAHHHVHEDGEAKRILGYKIANIDYDTEYAEYIAYSNRRFYSLAEIAEVRFPEYAGYKDMIIPFVGKPEEGKPPGNYDLIPHKIMTIYNGADCSLSKLIEKTTKNKISLPLLHVYMDVAHTFDAMNKTGPYLDVDQYNLVSDVLPGKIKRIVQQLSIMAGNPSFNPGSVPQLKKFLYGTLELEQVFDKKGKLTTNEMAIAFLKQFHEAPELIDKYRKYTKMKSTYLEAFAKSAKLFEGMVRTIWRLTGTATGRSSSGGGGKSGKKREGIVNLQNVHGEPMLKNLLISDVNWRRVLRMLDDDPELMKTVREEIRIDREKRKKVA